MNIDRKYKIHAVNPCSKNTHDEHDSILFLAKDKAVPAMLRAYLTESDKLGANPAHLESIGLLIGRVEQYQREVEAKIPDTDLPCEIRRCVDGDGVSDNKQDLAPGAQDVPKEAIAKILTEVMGLAVSNGANSVSMPDDYVEVAAWLCGIPAQPAPSVPTVAAAAAMGAKGGHALEGERLAFEAWVRGHGWSLCARWNGEGYVGDLEQGGAVCPHAMRTRMMWAAWRDRAALAAEAKP